MGWEPCPSPDTKGCLISDENTGLHESMPNAGPVAQDSATKELVESKKEIEDSSKGSTPVILDEPATKPESETITDPTDNACNASADMPSLAQAQFTVSSESIIRNDSQPKVPKAENGTKTKKELEPEEQHAGEFAMQPEKSNFDDADETTESDKFRIVKTIPATKALFEKPRIATLEFTKPSEDGSVALAPDREQKSSRKVSKTSELLPVLPASAKVAIPITSALTIADSTNNLETQGPTSRLTELKLLMKEARLTALHLSLAEKPEVKNPGVVSPSKSESKAESAHPVQEITPSKSDEVSFPLKPAFVEPTSKKQSLLDRLCPKS